MHPAARQPPGCHTKRAETSTSLLLQDERRGPGRSPPAAAADEDGELDDEDLLASTAGVDEAAVAARPAGNSNDSRRDAALHVASGSESKPVFQNELHPSLSLGSCCCTEKAVRSGDDWAAVQIGRVSATNSFWQHLTGHVTSSQWPMLHDGAGCCSGTAEALPLKANI